MFFAFFRYDTLQGYFYKQTTKLSQHLESYILIHNQRIFHFMNPSRSIQ